MDANPPSPTTTQIIRNFATKQLRQDHPFLKTEALERMVETITKTLEDGLAKQAPIMAESKARINLLSLPPEIRNQIYEMTLEVKHTEITAAIFSRDSVKHWDLDVWLPRPQLHDSRVMELTSHQARSEARALYYDLNIFKIEIHGIATLALHRQALASYFRKVISPKAKLFKKLVLRLMDTQVQSRLANYVWLRHFPQGNALPYTLYHGPAPLVTKEMLLSMFPFNEMGVLNEFVNVELRDPRGIKWEKMITEEEARAVLGTAQREWSGQGSSTGREKR